MKDNPFFIIGAPRSGTTLLRNVLRLHSRLECPEETHFFRWADAFRSPRYRQYYANSPLFNRHREIDGIDNFAFQFRLQQGVSRGRMQDWYGDEFLRVRGNPDGRWFDKTPQNVYGILLISEYYPRARFIHLHRHPLNVVASLVEGKVMPPHDLTGAVNCWLETMMIMRQYKACNAERVLDVSYERFTENAASVIQSILEFVDESDTTMPYDKINVHQEKNKYRQILDDNEVEQVLKLTEAYRPEYGY